MIGGTVLTTALFTVFKRLLTWYLAHVGSYAAYGAVGAVLGLLFWIYMSTLLFFFGAEFTRVYAERFGSLAKATQASRKDETRAERVSEASQPERPSRAHSLP